MTATRQKQQLIEKAIAIYDEWVKARVRFEIDFSQGEDGVARNVPMGEPPSISQWLDEWTGEFASAFGWIRFADVVESLADDEIVGQWLVKEIRGIRRCSICGKQQIVCKCEQPATRKVFIDVLAYDVNYITRIVEVPANWNDADIAKISGRNFDDESADWEVEGGGVIVQDQIRVGPDAPSDAQADLILIGDPPKQEGNKTHLSNDSE